MKQFNVWLFTSLYWALAAGGLFFERYAVAQGHMEVSLVRHFYIFFIGLTISSMALPLVKRLLAQPLSQKLLYGLVFCLVSALIAALVLNPVTYMMVGYELASLSLRVYLTGFLYFFLFYLLWLSLYAHFSHVKMAAPLVVDIAPEEPIGSTGAAIEPSYFEVEKLGEKRQLCTDDIVLIRAQGDYVELVTETTSYIVKQTMAAMLVVLNPLQFYRIHRSCIINKHHLLAVKPRPHGVYHIDLSGGQTALSSRSYKTRVEELLPKAQ